MPVKIKILDSTWPPDDSSFFNEIILNYDNWNDYSYRTSFGMFYCDKKGVCHQIGYLKIYFWENDETRTDNYSTHTKQSLDETIIQLDERYCSCLLYTS